MTSLLKYAAIFIIFLGLGYFFQDELNNSKGQDKLIPANVAFTLELEDERTDILSSGYTKEVIGSKRLY